MEGATRVTLFLLLFSSVFSQNKQRTLGERRGLRGWPAEPRESRQPVTREKKHYG